MPSLLASSCSAVSAVKAFLAKGFLSVFCRRRLSGFGLDSAVDGPDELLELGHDS
jgi:hypothetical protein